MDDEIITEETENTEPAEKVTYTAEEMYLLASKNQEDFSPYYKAIRETAEQGAFAISFIEMSPALCKDLKSNGFQVTYDAWDSTYKVSWK